MREGLLGPWGPRQAGRASEEKGEGCFLKNSDAKAMHEASSQEGKCLVYSRSAVATERRPGGGGGGAVLQMPQTSEGRAPVTGGPVKPQEHCLPPPTNPAPAGEAKASVTG